jgi:ABC-2 type transport system ATP-binding protein
MITLRRLTKRYGDKLAVDDVSVDILPGRVTGFLGPNGAGKSTTMRLIVGHDHPTSGEALIHGKPYAALPYPLHEVGAVLDARALHPGRSARHHLLAMARSNGIPRRRVDEVIEMVGLGAVASRRTGGFSLGMSQRLGIAGALLGDPGILIFDEPVNGLDLEGVRWVRALARSLAEEGRTVFISSHLLTEMQLTADHLVVIGKGRLIADEPIEEMVDSAAPALVRVRSPDAEPLTALVSWCESAGRTVERPGVDTVIVHGATVEEVGDAAHRLGVRLHELRAETASLEEAYLRLTHGSAEYTSSTPPGGGEEHGGQAR